MGRALALVVAAAVALSGCDDEESSSPSVMLDGSFVSPPPRTPDAGCDASVGLQDFDRDGFSRSNGDCDDCDRTRGPGALEVPANGVDEDCMDGDAPAPEGSCDAPLDPRDTRVEAAIAALGLCRPEVSESSRESGLIEARWWRIGGGEELADPRQVWLPNRFGARIVPKEGTRLLVLSTGVARDPSVEAYTPGCDLFTPGVPPPEGFPRDSSECADQRVSADARAYDDVGLRLTLRVPSNATGIAFDSIFFTYEYPDFVCKEYNDFFVALLDDAPRRFPDGNVLLDQNGDPIGVNTGLLSVCERSRTRPARRIDCQAGPDLLEGTGFAAEEATCGLNINGFEDIGGASTGWLHTEIAFEPTEVVELTFLLWDSGDARLDSTVAIDNLRFTTTPVQTGTRPAAAN